MCRAKGSLASFAFQPLGVEDGLHIEVDVKVRPVEVVGLWSLHVEDAGHPGLAPLIPDPAGKYITAYLPTNAGQLIVQTHQQSGDVLTPWQGFGVFGLWVAVLLVLAGLLLQRRDA